MNINKKFLLGASTAAYQVEGNNINSDLWTMEHLEHSSFIEKSGIATDQYSSSMRLSFRIFAAIIIESLLLILGLISMSLAIFVPRPVIQS